MQRRSRHQTHQVRSRTATVISFRTVKNPIPYSRNGDSRSRRLVGTSQLSGHLCDPPSTFALADISQIEYLRYKKNSRIPYTAFSDNNTRIFLAGLESLQGVE
jgi:hypothetical protein